MSASAGDPSADWDLIDDADEEEDVGDEAEKAFKEGADNRLIGEWFIFVSEQPFTLNDLIVKLNEINR